MKGSRKATGPRNQRPGGRKSDGTKSAPAQPKSICRRVKRILDTTSPKSRGWRSLSLWWGNNCI